MPKKKCETENQEININKRVKTCNEILKPVLGNDLSNIITNMLPTEKDRFCKIFGEYVNEYGRTHVYLDRQYKCGCFRLHVTCMEFYDGECDFSFKCTNHELANKIRNEIEELEKEYEVTKKVWKKKINSKREAINNIFGTHELELLPDELFYKTW